MPAYRLTGAVVAVDKGGVRGPGRRGLVLELDAAWAAGPDAFLDLGVDGLLDEGLDLVQMRCDLADVGETCAVV